MMKKNEKKKKSRVDLKMIMAPVSIDFSNNSLESSFLDSLMFDHFDSHGILIRNASIYNV